MTKNTPLNDLTFRPIFEGDTGLQKYQHNALQLFALGLYLRVDDIDEFAVASLTDGPDDKKVDICHIDLNEGRVIISQGYFAQVWGKSNAAADKASDLNTAVSWLLSADENRIPQSLKAKALELRRSLKDGAIRRIELFLIHNCYESNNVSNELRAVVNATSNMLHSLTPESVAVSHHELGLNEIESLYRARDRDIMIDTWIDVPAKGMIRQTGDGWTAIVTSVSADWLRRLYQSHHDQLFSANFRDYLGIIERKGNINNGIKQTATTEPENFWVFNNGVTAITHELQVQRRKVRIRGISVVNGAQTSGSLGEIQGSQLASATVLLRIVECKEKALVDKIIKYNNTQNEIRPADSRSSDPLHNRVRQDFLRYEIVYLHRRSSMRTPKNALTIVTLAPWLCAFHGDHQTASRNAREIFSSDEIYGRVFRSTITVEHIFLVSTLAAAIDRYKYLLKVRVADGLATELERKQYEVLKYAMSKNFTLLVVGRAAEEIVKTKVADLFEWKCRAELMNADGNKMIDIWLATLQALMPQIANLVVQEGSAYDVTRSSELTTKIAKQLKALLASLESSLGPQFEQIRKATAI